AQGLPGSRTRGPRRGTAGPRYVRPEAARRSPAPPAREPPPEPRAMDEERVRRRAGPREHRVAVRLHAPRRPEQRGDRMNATPAVEASSLSRRYGKAWGLHDCSLSLPTGRVVALVGPNGAGK